MGKLSDHFIPDRYRSQARLHASARTNSNTGSLTGDLPPSHLSETPKSDHAGGLGTTPGRGPPVVPSHAAVNQDGPHVEHGGNGYSGGGAEKSSGVDVEDAISQDTPPPAPPPHTVENEKSGNTALGAAQGAPPKPPIFSRMKAGCYRFGVHFKNAIFHSWVNVLLVAVPAGIAAEAAGLNASAVFAINAVAIVPLAGMLSHATENVASRLGDTLGALLNVSFGNAVELIIFIIALVKNEIAIVQASLLGSILANLLLILGMAFLLGGLRYREQVYNSTVTQMSACLLSLSVTSLVLPTAFHASFNSDNTALADRQVLKVSRGTSVVLLIVYILYLLFQLKSHAFMYESMPQAYIDEESHPGVLADIMNSSSSSDGSSRSDSTDSDTSGSVVTTGKRVKRMFRHRKRRKSSASVSSTHTTSVVPSALSSPSTTERQDNYWTNQVAHQSTSRRESVLGAIASGDEADHDDDRITPRIRDFVPPESDHSKSPEAKKRRKKRGRKRDKKRRHREEEKEAAKLSEQPIAGPEPPPNPPVNETPKVGFADEVHQVAGDVLTHPVPASTSGRLALNMRQLGPFRPALPKMLSNNVFVQPAPNASPATRPPGPERSQSAGNGLRRARSMPDRLNVRPGTSPGPRPIAGRTDPLPPYQHQRAHYLRPSVELNAEVAEEGSIPQPVMSRTASIVLLLASTALVAVCAEFMVSAIPDMINEGGSGVNEAFIGLIILPIVGNAAEHVTAVTVATKNKMDLAIGVAVGSSIQIALFVTPIVVLLGWILGRDMSLYFNLFDTICLFVTAFVVNFLVLDGRSNYLEGSLLIAAYVIIALGAFYYPPTDSQSSFAGGTGNDQS